MEVALDFDAIYREHAEALWRMSVRLTGSESEAWDVVQAALVKAMTKRSYKGKAGVRAWLMAIARNEALDRLRRRGKVEVGWPDGREAGWAVADAGDSLRQLLQEEENRALYRAFLDLPEKDREMLALRYQDGLSFEEAAHVMGVRSGTLRTAVHRAVHKLKEAMAKEVGDEQPLRRAQG